MLKFRLNSNNYHNGGYDNSANAAASASDADPAWRSYCPNLSRVLRRLGYSLLVPSLLFGCASGTAPGQWSDGSGGATIYTLTGLYDGEPGSRERAAKHMDINSKNMCISGSYTLLSQESVPIINRLGEANFSRLIWRIECVQTTEEAASGASQGGTTAR